MKTYTITTTHQPDEEEMELRIHFTFIPGCPARGPSYASGGEPACPAEVEFDRVERQSGSAWLPAPEFDEWAEDWLQTLGYDAAIAEAEASNAPDPDDERDRRWDDQMTWGGR